MALKKEALAAIAKLTKLKVEDLESAIKDEKEVDLAIDEKLTVFTDDEVTTLKNNEYKNGKEKGVEMAVKETKEKLGLEFQGKTIDGLVTAAQTKAVEDAKVSPDKKVTELTEKLKTVQETAADLQKKLAEKESEVAGVKLNGELYKNVPAGTSLEPDEVIGIMKLKGYDFKIEDGKLVAVKDGKVLQDKVANALPVKQVIEEFVTEKKLIADGGSGGQGDPGGRGGGSGKPPVKFGTLSEIKKHFTDNGKSLLGTEFSEAVQKAVTENKDFAMDK